MTSSPPSPLATANASNDAALPPTAAELTIVVPTYNEVGNVAALVQRLEIALVDLAWEAVFVDDNSPDGTADTVRALAQKDPRIRLLHRVGRRGLSGATIEGIMSSSAPFVAVMDGDLQHDEALLPPMLAALRQGADLAVGSRYVAGGSAVDGFSEMRSLGSRLATWLSQRVLKATLTDPMSGFFCVKRSLFAETVPQLATDGFKILFDFVASVERPLKVVELPFDFRARHAGLSKLDSSVTADFLGLLLAKLSGNVLSIRFFLFMLVGFTGVFVHLVGLRLLMTLGGLAFEWAQLGATLVAMTSNFFFNNWLTFRDKRLKGWGLAMGLLSFYLVCSVGLIANVGVATWIHSYQALWWVAGGAGALMGAVFNYAAASTLTWRAR